MPSSGPDCEGISTPSGLVLFLTSMKVHKGFFSTFTAQVNHRIAKESAKNRGGARSCRAPWLCSSGTVTLLALPTEDGTLSLPSPYTFLVMDYASCVGLFTLILHRQVYLG